jgi:capsid protein
MVALGGADTDRLLGPWAVGGDDPNEVFSYDGEIVANRGIWLDDNDPIAHAIVDTLVRGTIGADGLKFQSAFELDGNPHSITDAEHNVRAQINRSVRRGTMGKRFDAEGMLTRVQMSKTICRQAICTGSGFSQKLWKPNRPGNPSHATCWRLIHSARVCNIDFQPNNDRWVNGFKLNANGDPIAIGVMKAHPNALQAKPEWVTVPLYLPDGSQNVVYLPSLSQPGQLRGPGWFNQVIPLLRFLGRTMEAKVIADLMKASVGFIIECDDPAAMARQDRNGAVLTKTTKIKPGMKYYVKKGTNWKEFNLNFNGADFNAWGDFLLKITCANFGMPWQFVMQQLTDSNMAAARVALIQAYQTFNGHGTWMIDHVEDPWNRSLISEDIVRERIDIGAADLDDAFLSRYILPPRPMPNPLQEAQAAVIRNQQLGYSLGTLHGEAGSDLEEEANARPGEQSLLDRNGVTIVPMGGTPPEPVNEDDDGAAKPKAKPKGISNQNAPAKVPTP